MSRQNQAWLLALPRIFTSARERNHRDLRSNSRTSPFSNNYSREYLIAGWAHVGTVPVGLASLLGYIGVQRSLLDAITGGVGSSGIQHRLLRALACRADLGPESALAEPEQRSEVGETCGYNAN